MGYIYITYKKYTYMNILGRIDQLCHLIYDKSNIIFINYQFENLKYHIIVNILLVQDILLIMIIY